MNNFYLWIRRICVTLFLALCYQGTFAKDFEIVALVRVDDQVVTSRDLRLHQFFNEWQRPLKGYLNKRHPLSELVSELLISTEYSKTFSKKLKSSTLRTHCSKLQKRLSKDSLWRGLNVSKKEFYSFCRMKIATSELLNVKLPKNLAIVRGAELKTYFESHIAEFQGQTLESVSEKLRQRIKAEKNQKRFEDWMQTLMRNHKVSYFSGYQIQ